MKETKLFDAHTESFIIENSIRKSSYLVPFTTSNVNHYNLMFNDLNLCFEYIMHFDEELKGIVFYFTLTRCDIKFDRQRDATIAGLLDQFNNLVYKRTTFKILLRLDQYTKEKEFNFSSVLNQLKTLVFVKGISNQLYEKYDKKVKITFNESFNRGILSPTEIFIGFTGTHNYTSYQYNPYKDYDVNYNELCKEIDSIMIKKRSKLVEFLVALIK